MAFQKQEAVVPVSIGNIQIVLDDPNPNPPVGIPFAVRPQSATAVIQVIFSDGTSKTLNANIPDHFSVAVVNQLITFAASVRTKANNEILGD